MSYCRWSCDTYRSCVYMYKNVDGCWTTHVAGNRITDYSNAPPEIPDEARGCMELWIDRHQKVIEWAGTAPAREAIDHPHAGKSFDHSTPGECADFLQGLKDDGLHIPNWVIPDLKEEQAEMDANPEEEG